MRDPERTFVGFLLCGSASLLLGAVVSALGWWLFASAGDSIGTEAARGLFLTCVAGLLAATSLQAWVISLVVLRRPSQPAE